MRETQLELQRERELVLDEKMNAPKKLRVYIDYENQKYYIDMAAAFALGLITYKQWTLNDNAYYEITSRQLDEYKRVYEIVYEHFNVKKPETFAYNLNDNAYSDDSIYIDNDKIKTNSNKLNDNAYSDDSIYIDNDKIKTNSNKLNELKNLRDKLVPENINNETDYKDSNDINKFIPKK